MQGSVKRFLIFFLLLALPVVVQSAGERNKYTVTFSRVDNLKHTKSITTPSGQVGYVLSDLSRVSSSPRQETELYCSFSRPSRRMGKDDMGYYRVRKASYSLVKGKGAYGPGAAHFYHQNHGVEFQTEKEQWFGRCGDLGSFTIEFRIRPASLRDGSVILSRLGYSSGKKTGLDIVIIKRRIVARFFNVFQDQYNRKVDVVMDSGQYLERNQWYHYMLSYNRLTGGMKVLVNGKETEKVYLTASGKPEQGGYMPSFSPWPGGGSCPDLPVVYLGNDFSGMLDEFRVSVTHEKDYMKRTDPLWNRYRDPALSSRTPYNFEGLVTSPVYHFDGTGTRVVNLSWTEKLLKNTYVWVEFRISDTLFYHHDQQLPWYRVKNGERKIYLQKLKDGSWLRGKFYQWRAHLVPSPDGKRSPVFYGINLEYQRDLPPRTPLFFEAIAQGNEQVTLRWMKNIEPDMGGYIIYYGIRPGKYDGVIFTVDGKAITNTMGEGNYVSITLTNSIIKQNLERDGRKVLTYPRLQNDVLYFFAVSAYDNYKPGTPHNHESPVSKPITARPFGGNTIR